jgi:hypothetical protein
LVDRCNHYPTTALAATGETRNTVPAPASIARGCPNIAMTSPGSQATTGPADGDAGRLMHIEFDQMDMEMAQSEARY